MIDPSHPLAELLRRDKRYHLDAYVFVFDALRYAHEQLGMGRSPGSIEDTVVADEIEEDRHITGQQLCEAIRLYAMKQYGGLAKSVLNHWGVNSTGDFGEIVFNLISIGQMRKTDSDRREDFDHVFDFSDAFRDSFGPLTSDTPKGRSS
ncbi:MAG: Minf_1886 family protein [Pirellulales bacterium]